MPLTVSRIEVKNQKLKALIYGKPGMGKTSLAATAREHPDMSPILYADLEGGLLSVADYGIDHVSIRQSADMEELYWALNRRDESVAQYKTLIIDSGSVLASRILTEWAQRNMERQQRRGKAHDRTIDDVELGDYGKTTVQVVRLFSWFLDLPIHIIITAIEKEQLSKGDNPVVQAVRPMFTDALGSRLMGMVDHVWYLYKDDNERRYLLTRQQGIYEAKTRGAAFQETIGSIVTDPNLATLYSQLIDAQSRAAEAAMLAEGRQPIAVS